MSTKNSPLTVVAHRGGPGDKFSENSREAFARAVKKGYPIETDIWLHNDDLIISHDPPEDDTKYMTLEELLSIVAGKVDIYLELKRQSDALALLAAVKKIYKKHLPTVIITSFEKDALRTIREKDKNIRLGLLYRGIDNYFIDIAEDIGADFVGFNWLRVIPNYFNIKQSRESIDAKYFAYTIDSPFLAKTIKKLGIDGIFTDYPESF